MAEEFDFDVVIVGSGFGGSVAAAVLAEGGLRVCVLERGRAYPPGSFPRNPKAMSENFWDPNRGYHGLFQLWSFRRTDALTSSGLGGGSLIYANVMLRKPEDSYLRWDWRNEREAAGWAIAPESLRDSYAWVEKRIGVNPLPKLPAFAAVRRTEALEDVSAKLNAAGFPTTFGRPPLAVSFGAPGAAPQPGAPIGQKRNIHTELTGVPTYRTACLICGECDLGCNYGSKNSLDHTLLTQASVANADIRPLHEVTDLRRRGAGWEVVAQDRTGIDLGEGHPPGESFDGGQVVLTARRVVLAAGTFGTTYMLLRLVRNGLPGISDALGRCFSGNGDLINWVSGSEVRLDGDRGPVVTSLFRSDAFRKTADGQRVRTVRYVQDGGYPGLLGWLAETITPAVPAKLARFAFRRWWAAFRRDPNRGLAADVSSLIGTARSTRTLPLLGIGMDVADGQLTLHRRHKKRLDMAPPSGRSDAYYEAVSDTMTRIGAALRARRVIGSPWWGLRRSVTVHPLGGCPMGVTAEDGVVNEWGEVFGHLDSLYVMDGSVMPGPIGPNPALTIAAFAERASRHLLGRADQEGRLSADRGSVWIGSARAGSAWAGCGQPAPAGAPDCKRRLKTKS